MVEIKVRKSLSKRGILFTAGSVAKISVDFSCSVTSKQKNIIQDTAQLSTHPNTHTWMKRSSLENTSVITSNMFIWIY